MNHVIFEDKQAGHLLEQVRNDLSSLRHDVRRLVSHTTRRTLPQGARELARSGRERLLHGRDYAADQIRRVGRTAREHPAGVSVAGLVLLGAAALVGYYLLRGACCTDACADCSVEQES